MPALAGFRNNLSYLGTHALLLAGAVGLLFLQRSIWLLRIAEQGYGPYQTVTYLATVSAVMVLIDLIILRWALRGSQTSRTISLLWPGLFFGSALWVVLANNA
jgi:hypothetical protein